ncbi:MAG: ATP-binding protein [Simkania sp.]|nr:ATP-binding protein [Simkania sp.]
MSYSSHSSFNRFAEATLADLWLPEESCEQVLDWMTGNKNFLVYLGNPGIGKTHLSRAVLKDYTKGINHKRYWKEADLLARLRSGMDDRGDYIENLKYLCDDDLIIIDDLGSCGLTDWRKEVLFALIDFRYESMKPTMFTSNLSRNDFKENFEPRVFSRLFDKENTILEISGKDRRLN